MIEEMESGMFFLVSKSRWLAIFVLMMVTFSTKHLFAQDKNAEAQVMISSAMDAYSNLEMDRAKELLETALAFGDELEDSILSKIHASLGILAISGFSDTPTGQTHFTKALCLDENAKIDPLFSTPEIDLVFTQAKEAVSPERCEELGILLPGGGVEMMMDPCGVFQPLEEQKKNHELPFFIELSPAVKYQVSKMVLHYSYDSGKYRELELTPKAGGTGFGALIECDIHDLRISDPSVVQYYIEGLASDGKVVCGQGMEEYPLSVTMSSEAPPLPEIAGMVPRECVQCAPWDDACRKKQAAFARGDATSGEPCTNDADCVAGLICDPELFVCSDAKGETREDNKGTGPKVFYVMLGGGSGGGYMTKDLSIKKVDFAEGGNNKADPRIEAGVEESVSDPAGQIVTINRTAKGLSWTGVPVRLTLGYQITPKLSVELSGRVDVFIVSNSSPRSCYDAAGGDLYKMVRDSQNREACSMEFPTDDRYSEEEMVAMGKVAVAWKSVEGTDDHELIMDKTYQFSWMINARARYKFLMKKSLALSAFGGLGYGRIQYRATDDNSGEVYFPLPGMVNIEVGLGFAYFFTDNVGVVADIPIDVVVGDGFGFNAELNLGVGFGF